MSGYRIGAPGLFGGSMTREEQLQKQIEGPAAGSGSLRDSQPVSYQPQPQQPQQVKAKKPCPLWIRDEECAGAGYLPR